MKNILSRITLILVCAGTLSSAEIVHQYQSDMTLPTDIAILADGRICVADGVNARILVFDSRGASTELRFPEMKRPLGLAADDNGGLLVSDTQAKSVFILDKYLNLKVNIPLESSVDPTDVLAVGKQLWVVDNDGHQILVIDRKGQLKHTLGKKGSVGPTFSYPSTISSGKDDQIFVCDVLNGRLQLFNTDFSYQGQIADWGITPGKFFRPKGVASQADGRIAVSDSFTGTLQIFKSQSSEGTMIVDSNSNPLHFQNPTGIAWDKSGLLWVVESATGSVMGVQLP